MSRSISNGSLGASQVSFSPVTSVTDRYSSTSLVSTIGLAICAIPKKFPGITRSTYWSQNPLKVLWRRSRVRSENPSAKMSSAPATSANVRAWLAILERSGSTAGNGEWIMLVRKWKIWFRSSLCLRSSPKIIGSSLGGVGGGGGGGGGGGTIGAG